MSQATIDDSKTFFEVHILNFWVGFSAAPAKFILLHPEEAPWSFWITSAHAMRQKSSKSIPLQHRCSLESRGSKPARGFSSRLGCIQLAPTNSTCTETRIQKDAQAWRQKNCKKIYIGSHDSHRTMTTQHTTISKNHGQAKSQKHQIAMGRFHDIPAALVPLASRHDETSVDYPSLFFLVPGAEML